MLTQAVMLSGTARPPGQCCFSPLEPSLLQLPALINDLGNSLCWGMTEFTLHKCWPQLKHTHLPYYLSIIFQRYTTEDKYKTFKLRKKFFTLPMTRSIWKSLCHAIGNEIAYIVWSHPFFDCNGKWLTLWCVVWKVQEDNTIQHAQWVTFDML